MLTWVVFVHYFEVSFMVEDVFKRPFITVGMTVFVILFSLAITSNRWSMRKLDGSGEHSTARISRPSAA
jgi:sulfoxide reductase heme-binding subunit YedZ